MAKYNQYYSILSAIRRCFSRSPVHRAALNAAKVEEKGPRGGARYRCASCSNTFGSREVEVDHISEVVGVGEVGAELSWDTIVQRIFCDSSNLQVLCKKCHKLKSKEARNAKTKGKSQQSEGKGSTKRKRSK